MSIESMKSLGMKSGACSAGGLTITAAGLMVASLCAFAGAAQRDGVVVRAGEPEVNTVVSTSSESTFIVNENGKKIEVRLRDGEVVKATLDGKEIPKDRVKTENGTMTIVDEQGNVLTRMEVPKVETIELGTPRNRGNGERRIFRIPAPNGQQRLMDQDAIVQMEKQEKPAVMLGVRLAPVPGVLARYLGIDAENAVLIAGVAEGTPAAAAGLKPYDIVTALNGEKLEGPESIGKKLKESKAKAGDEIKLSVLSKGTAKDATLKLVAYDAEVMAKAEWESVDEADAEMPMSGRMFNVPMNMEPMIIPHMEGMDREGMDQLNEKIQREIERAMRSREKAQEKLREIGPMMRERQMELDVRRGDMNERLKKLEAELEAVRKKLEQQQQQPPAKDAPAENTNTGGGR
ncbi:MAG: PDZ domain-containing protein [Phycisphaerales bacterium]|nr:PDZ domain-containing protein [Phycisphaerales bacterium]